MFNLRNGHRLRVDKLFICIQLFNLHFPPVDLYRHKLIIHHNQTSTIDYSFVTSFLLSNIIIDVALRTDSGGAISKV